MKTFDFDISFKKRTKTLNVFKIFLPSRSLKGKVQWTAWFSKPMFKKTMFYHSAEILQNPFGYASNTILILRNIILMK